MVDENAGLKVKDLEQNMYVPVLILCTDSLVAFDQLGTSVSIEISDFARGSNGSSDCFKKV